MNATDAKCRSGHKLDVEQVGPEGQQIVYRCHCPVCWARAQRGEGDGFIVTVNGYGPTPEAAIAEYHDRDSTF